jgi:hypothetical protein
MNNNIRQEGDFETSIANQCQSKKPQLHSNSQQQQLLWQPARSTKRIPVAAYDVKTATVAFCLDYENSCFASALHMKNSTLIYFDLFWSLRLVSEHTDHGRGRSRYERKVIRTVPQCPILTTSNQSMLFTSASNISPLMNLTLPRATISRGATSSGLVVSLLRILFQQSALLETFPHRQSHWH